VKNAPDEATSDKVSTNVVEMIVEVFKRTGKELTDNDIEIVIDATKQMGADLGKVRISLLKYSF
jgi:hypothetical protein